MPTDNEERVSREEVRAALDRLQSQAIMAGTTTNHAYHQAWRDVRNVVAQLLDTRDRLDGLLERDDDAVERVNALLKRMDLEPGIHDVETHVFNVSVYPTYQTWSRAANSGGPSTYDDAVKYALDNPMTSRHQVVDVLVLRRTLLKYTAAAVDIERMQMLADIDAADDDD